MKKIILLVLVCLFTLSLFGCGKDSEKTIKVGASSTPHAVILEYIKPYIEEKGYKLEIVVYDDYVMPNIALFEKELDANYFQHTPYLNSYNEQNHTDLESAFLVHYEPFGIYGKNIDDLNNLKAGAKILIPADDSNETRALLLLAQAGLITLKNGKNALTGITTFDIENNNGYTVEAVEASTVTSQLNNSDDGTIAVVNGNYALQAGLKVTDALEIEDKDGDAALTYANIIAVRNGDKDNEKIKLLIEALNRNEVKEYIQNTFNGSVLPIF